MKAANSLLVLAGILFATVAMAQSDMGEDASGRFDGSPPLGTDSSTDDGSFRIPIDAPVPSDPIVVIQPRSDIECGIRRDPSATVEGTRAAQAEKRRCAR